LLVANGGRILPVVPHEPRETRVNNCVWLTPYDDVRSEGPAHLRRAEASSNGSAVVCWGRACALPRHVTSTASRTAWRGPSRHATDLEPRNDEGRLGFPRAAFPTRSAHERTPRKDPPRSRSGYRNPWPARGANTSSPQANVRTGAGLLAAAWLRAWFAWPGTTWWVFLFDGQERPRIHV